MKAGSRFCVPLTVYYDASCPMCATEMRALRDLDWRGWIRLVDCSARDFDDRAIRREGVTRADLMTRIHARDPEGRWLVGIDAFEALYDAAGLDAAARFCGSRRLRPLLDRIYARIARYRQPLSKLGMNWLIGLIMRRAARSSRGRFC